MLRVVTVVVEVGDMTSGVSVVVDVVSEISEIAPSDAVPTRNLAVPL